MNRREIPEAVFSGEFSRENSAFRRERARISPEISACGISSAAGIGFAIDTPVVSPSVFHAASRNAAISSAPSSRRGAGSPLVRE